MKFMCYQLFFLAVCQVCGVAQCSSRLGKECPLSEAQESTLTNESRVESELSKVECANERECNRKRMTNENNRANRRHNGFFKKAIKSFKNISYSDIAYDLFSDFIPLRRLKYNARPQIVKEKKNMKNMKMSLNVPIDRNISCIQVYTSPPKLKLKRNSVMKDSNKNRSNNDMGIEKRNFTKEPISKKQETFDHKTRKEMIEKVFVNNVIHKEGNSVGTENGSTDGVMYPQDVCCTLQLFNMNPNLKLKEKEVIHKSTTNTPEVLNKTVSVLETLAAVLKDLEGSLKEERFSPDGESRKEESMVCTRYACRRPKYHKSKKNKQYETEEKTLSGGLKKSAEEFAKESEFNMKELADNIEGIKLVLLDRQQQLNTETLTDHDLLKNISSLIEKLNLLRDRLEMLNVTHIENNILTPDEESFITGLKLNLNEVDSDNVTDEKWPTEGYYKYNNLNNKYVFSSAWGQCAVCIAIANKLHEAFMAILNNLEFKDIPPPYLNLGDDWCMNFSESSGPMLIEIQQNWPILFHNEEIAIQFQSDLANEFFEKCSLYRSLISDLQLYQHWLRYNKDMIKVLCGSDYSIEFKSCTPFIL